MTPIPPLADEGKVLAVVIGRAGSKGLPRKNALPVAGVPMIARTIRFARASREIDRVIVSTDGDEIARIARDEGAEVFLRPESVSNDQATVDSAVRHAVEASASRAGVVVILYGNVPVRPADLADRAVRALRETGADSVQSYYRVGKTHPFWMSRLDGEGRVSQFIADPAIVASGGHVGFVAGGHPLAPRFWAEAEAARFVTRALA